MFLNPKQNLRTATRDERGSTLIAVIGLVALTAIITVTITTASVSALGVTSSTRAGVEARAAAEAGVDHALVALQGTCSATYASSIAPAFDYRIAYAMDSADPTWLNGCPPDNANLVRITSTGHAASGGVGGATNGDTKIVQAIYAWIPQYVEVPQVDAAVYAHTIEGTLKNFILSSSSESLSADIQIKNGNVLCENGASIGGNVALANGYLELNNCDVTGSVHVSGHATVSGNNTDVGGDVLAQGIGVAAGADTVHVKSGADVGGSVYAGGDVRVDADIDGSATAAGSATTAIRVGSTGRIGGAAISSGPVELNGGTISGAVSTAISGLTAVPAPRVPDWTDLPYPSTSWNGYLAVTWAGDCQVGGTHPFWDSLAALTATSGNIVVDARGCGAAGLDFKNNIKALVLSGNVVFVAHSFIVDKLVVDSNSSATRYLWFLVPDDVIDQQPTCTAPSGTITLTNEADIKPTIAAMVYTPCKIVSDRNHWRGQLYGGTVEFKQQALLTFAPVGVPGVDFDASLPPVLVLDSALLGSRVSYRELGAGG